MNSGNINKKLEAKHSIPITIRVLPQDILACAELMHHLNIPIDGKSGMVADIVRMVSGMGRRDLPDNPHITEDYIDAVHTLQTRHGLDFMKNKRQKNAINNALASDSLRATQMDYHNEVKRTTPGSPTEPDLSPDLREKAKEAARLVEEMRANRMTKEQEQLEELKHTLGNRPDKDYGDAIDESELDS